MREEKGVKGKKFREKWKGNFSFLINTNVHLIHNIVSCPLCFLYLILFTLFYVCIYYILCVYIIVIVEVYMQESWNFHGFGS